MKVIDYNVADGEIFRPAQMQQHLSEFGKRPPRDTSSIGTPKNADGTPNYNYLDLGEWWHVTALGELGRGFVSNSRFASSSTERVIPRTNRSAQRKKFRA